VRRGEFRDADAALDDESQGVGVVPHLVRSCVGGELLVDERVCEFGNRQGWLSSGEGLTMKGV
jgi:hypothetical protein